MQRYAFSRCGHEPNGKPDAHASRYFGVLGADSPTSRRVEGRDETCRVRIRCLRRSTASNYFAPNFRILRLDR